MILILRWLVLAALAAVAWPGTAPSPAAAAPAAATVEARAQERVLATRVDAEITPVVADHITDGIERAEAEGYDAYVIELDTPGGLGESMNAIVQDILSSSVPVVVYVGPRGAQAASAGAFITLAAHVAVMAPGTSIGAATPVGAQGEDLSAKVVNAAAAQAESLAKLRGRNAAFAVEMVREGRSAGVDEAVGENVADARAGSLDAALAAADLAGAQVDRHDFGFLRQAQQVLANPNIAYVFMLLGILGLLYELASPGVGVAGAAGAVFLVLGMFSIALLPVQAVGVLMLALAAALFLGEVFAPGIAGFAAGGAVALVLAALFLFDDAQGVRVDPLVAVPAAVVMGLFVILAGRLAARARHGAVRTGAEALTGRTVTIGEVRDGEAGAYLDGSWWSVRSTGPPIREGVTARVVRLDGLTLVVEPQIDEID